jgi:predicted Rossmann-fold nucleotide-binding protein
LEQDVICLFSRKGKVSRLRGEVKDRCGLIHIQGPDNASGNLAQAEELGKAIAQAGFITLTGGRSRGVMDAACKGAKVRRIQQCIDDAGLPCVAHIVRALSSS